MGYSSCLNRTIVTQANNYYEEKVLEEAVLFQLVFGGGWGLKANIPSPLWPKGITVRQYIPGVDVESIRKDGR